MRRSRRRKRSEEHTSELQSRPHISLTPKKDTAKLVPAAIWHASWRRYSVSGAICNWADCHTVGESPSGSLVISLTAPIDASYLFCPLIIFL